MVGRGGGEGGVPDVLLAVVGKGLIGQVGFKMGGFIIFSIYFLSCELFLFFYGINQ